MRMAQEGLRYTWNKFSNWVTKVCKITWFLRKKSHIWSVILRRNSWHAGGLFLSRFDKKAWERLTIYLGKYDTVLRKWSSLKSLNCFCHKIGLSPVLKMAAFGLRFVQAKSAALKCCRPRTSDTAICGFRNVSRPVSGRIYQELAFFSHFLAQQLEITLFGLLVASQLDSLIL